MKIYNYHPTYRYYIGESLADKSPLEYGAYLVPAYASLIPPPEYEEGNIPIFNINSNNWDIIIDNRGIWYKIDNGFEYIIDDPSEQSIGLTRIKPPEIINNQTISWNGSNWEINNLEYIFPTPVEDIPEIDSKYSPIDFSSLSPQEKLENLGLTIDELKILLGLQ